MKIGILTDSTACLDFVSFQHPAVKVADFTVVIDDVQYKISELDPAEFYKKMEQAKQAPQTSQASVMEVVKSLEEFVEEGFTDILIMTISSKLSGSLANMNMAAKEFEDKLNIHVIDTLTTAYILGDAVVDIAKLIDQGKSVEELLPVMQKMYDHDGVLFYVDTLKYLVKGGRMSGAAGFVGEMLKVKPILELTHQGTVDLLDKSRTKKKTVPKMVEIYQERTKGKKHKLFALYTDNYEEVDAYLNELKKSEDVIETSITGLTPAVSSHIGGGLIGIGWRFVD